MVMEYKKSKSNDIVRKHLFLIKRYDKIKNIIKILEEFKWRFVMTNYGNY